jgi:chromate transporter
MFGADRCGANREPGKVGSDMTPAEDKPPVSLLEIFKVFFLIGAFSFGGGLIGWIHQETVTKRHWLKDEQFLSGLALGQVMPGANVTNMSVYIGQLLRGWVGAGVALMAVLTGPFFLVIALAAVYQDAIRIPGFHSAMDGIAAAAVGIVLRLGYVGARHSCRKLPQIAVAVAVFIAIGLMQWPLVPVVLVIAPVSIAIAWMQVRAHA